MTCHRIGDLILLLIVLSVGVREAPASPGSTFVKSLGQHLSKQGGQEAAEQIAKEVSQESVERLAATAVRQGGEESLERITLLTAKHGPEVIRALDNSPAAIPVFQALEELPPEHVAAAVHRLAAGSAGRELAETTIRWGAPALRAEVTHPGVGGRIVRALGNDGAKLCGRLSTDQAIVISRHADEIATLPNSLRMQVLEIISTNTAQCVAFLGRFIESNPKAILFTTSGALLFVNQSERLLGGDEMIQDANGSWQVVSKPGLFERATRPLVESAGWSICLIAIFICLMIALQLYRRWRGRRSLFHRSYR